MGSTGFTERHGVSSRFLGDDATFVRGSADTVYPLLTDLDLWQLWNPQLVVRQQVVVNASMSRPGNRWIGALDTGFARQIRLRMDADGWRHNEGFWVHLSGDVDGSSEWWLERERDGLVVHHLVRVNDAVPRPARARRQHVRRAEQYRRAIRIMMWGVREHVHQQS